MVAGILDRESKDSYRLKVAAVDGFFRSETELEIYIQDVNDNAPQFDETAYEFELWEGQPSETSIGRVSATDRDSRGPNSDVYYKLKESSEFFKVIADSGEIVSRLVFSYSDTLPQENSYSFVVIASDQGEPPLTNEVTVTVSVKPSNKHAPVFAQLQYVAAVSEDAVIGQSITQIIAR